MYFIVYQLALISLVSHDKRVYMSLHHHAFDYHMSGHVFLEHMFFCLRSVMLTGTHFRATRNWCQFKLGTRVKWKTRREKMCSTMLLG